MRIGIVWTASPRLACTTVRFERYLQGFQALGHEALIVSTEEAAEGFPWASVTVADLAALRDASLWARLKLDLALVVTWLGRSDVLAALRPHVRFMVSLTDSDGCVSCRVRPVQMLSRMWHSNIGLPNKLRTAGWWLRQYLGIHGGFDGEVLHSARLSDRIVVFSPGARDNLQGFFDYHRESALGRRLVVAPYPVADVFEDEPLTLRRDDQIVAIGRWCDPQKGADLLTRAMAHYLKTGGRWRFVLVGSGGESRFGRLQAAFPRNVDYRGVVGQSDVESLLGRSRILLSTSRWESGPIVASEAVLRGCSLVAPASIPGFRMFCNGDTCGTTFVARSARSVADALRREGEAWESGRRDPCTIAAVWRGTFTAKAVCQAILAGLEVPKAMPVAV